MSTDKVIFKNIKHTLMTEHEARLLWNKVLDGKTLTEEESLSLIKSVNIGHSLAIQKGVEYK